MLRKFGKTKKRTIFAKTFQNNFKKMELLTVKQKARRARNLEVAQVYREMRRKYPEASQSRIIDEMARRKVAGLTSVSGIRTALIDRGCITVEKS